MTWRPSLFRHLLVWAVGALLVVWAAFVAVGFRTGAHEADELTDGHLASVASLLLAQGVGEFRPAPSAAALGGRTELKAHDYQQSLSIFAWDSAGKLLTRIGEAPTPEFAEGEGFSNLSLGQPASEWRAYARWSRPRDVRIMVMLSLAEQDELADDIAAQVATPGLWLLPVVALVLTLAIRQGLRPLMDLSKEIHSLDIHRGAGVRGPPHEEFKAIADSINTLVGRYNAALERERALAGEVAHELRTPLSALSLHASSLRGPLSPAEREQALNQLESGAARAGTVLTHLLALARTSRSELAEAAEPVDLCELARQVTAEYAQSAFLSGHELSVDAQSPCTVRAHPVLLQIALRNLIGNALSHTPAGTAVQVSVGTNPPAIAVTDTGHARRRQGFVPAPATTSGLSLGHQVVRRVAAVHDGRLDVSGPGEGPTCYRIVLGGGAVT